MDVLGGGGGGISTQLLDNLTLLIFISDPIRYGGGQLSQDSPDPGSWHPLPNPLCIPPPAPTGINK